MRDPAGRTRMAWERSALGPLAAAALLLAKPLGPAVGRVLLAAADVLLALVVLGLGRRRDRQVRVGGTVADAGVEVLGSGVAVAVLGVATAVLLAVGT